MDHSRIMQCIRCSDGLLPKGDFLDCPTGHGRFGEGERLRERYASSLRHLRKAPSLGRGVTCICGSTMDVVDKGRVEVDHCRACDSVWLDPGEHLLPDEGRSLGRLLAEAFWTTGP